MQPIYVHQPMSLTRWIAVISLCLLLTGCALPLLVVPAVGSAIAVPLAVVFQMIGHSRGTYPLLYASTVYMGLVTAVLWIFCAEVVASRFENKEQSQPKNVYAVAMGQSVGSAVCVLLVLLFFEGLPQGVKGPVLVFCLTFIYVFVITFGAGSLKEQIGSLERELKDLSDKFPKHAEQMAGINSYGSTLKGIHRGQGLGYFAFYLAPVVVMILPAGIVAGPFSIIRIAGLGMLLFGAFGAVYVVVRSLSLSNRGSFKFERQVTYDEVKDLFQGIYSARVAILQDRIHTVLVSALSLITGYHLFFQSSFEWAQIAIHSVILMSCLLVIFCWLPFYIHQDSSKNELFSQIRDGGQSDRSKLRELRSELDTLCPSIPNLVALNSFAATLGLGGGVSLMSTIGKSFG